MQGFPLKPSNFFPEKYELDGFTKPVSVDRHDELQEQVFNNMQKP